MIMYHWENNCKNINSGNNDYVVGELFEKLLTRRNSNMIITRILSIKLCDNCMAEVIGLYGSVDDYK